MTSRFTLDADLDLALRLADAAREISLARFRGSFQKRLKADGSIVTEVDEAVIGESSVAAPIFDHLGHAVGAIGVVGDTERLIPRTVAKGLAAAVTEAARGVSRELGAPSWPPPQG